MENWQLTLVILASVLVGALIPLFVMMAIAFYRAGKEIADIGARLKGTLTQVEIISDRVETLSRGFKGGEADIADLLTSVGHLAHGLERNMNAINIFSAILAAVGPALVAYLKTWFPEEEPGKPLTPDVTPDPDCEPPVSSSATSPDSTTDPH